MNIEIYTSASEEETFQLGTDFSSRLRPGDVVAFFGELGAGKTEFIKGLCYGMNVHEIVASPTYTIINQYMGEDISGTEVLIYHIDLYRVDTAEEQVEVGLADIVGDPEAIKLIEWSENADTLLPAERYEIVLFNEGDENSRRIEIVRRTADGVEVPAGGRWHVAGGR
jgi:tRNA threonylcarbamoyladenosine biosynthesis protein TsaE